MTMRLLLFLVMATGVTWLTGATYRDTLARSVEAGFGVLNERVEVRSLDVLAPLDLMFFVALCLGAPGGQVGLRVRALLIGIPIVIGLQVMLCMLLVYVSF